MLAIEIFSVSSPNTSIAVSLLDFAVLYVGYHCHNDVDLAWNLLLKLAIVLNTTQLKIVLMLSIQICQLQFFLFIFNILRIFSLFAVFRWSVKDLSLLLQWVSVFSDWHVAGRFWQLCGRRRNAFPKLAGEFILSLHTCSLSNALIIIICIIKLSY